MEFIYSDLGYLYGGEIIEVTLDKAANVCLLDSNNFYKYKSGCDFNYRGGYIKVSPYRITVPHSGKWFVTIDLGEYGGNIRYNIQVIEPRKSNKISSTQIEKLQWQIQDDNPDCIVKVTSRWCEKHPEHGSPNTERTDFLVFDKKNGNLHKHFSIGEDTNWELKEWHDWY